MFGPNATHPATLLNAVTPNNDTVLSPNVRSLYVGGAGNLSLVDRAGTVTLLTGVQAGSILPIAPSRVRATDTTATLIVALS